MILLLMARKVRAEGVRLIHALYMMVIIVDSLQNKEILAWLALKNRVENTSVFGRDFRTISRTLNSVLGAMEAMSSHNSNNRLIILSNKAKCVIINNLCYYRIPHKRIIIVKIALKALRHANSPLLSCAHTSDSHGQ